MNNSVLHLFAFLACIYAPLYCSLAEKSTLRRAFFSEIRLRRVKYSFAVKYLLRKCEKGEFHFTFGVSRIFHLYIYLYFNEICLRGVKYSYAVKYLLRKCE